MLIRKIVIVFSVVLAGIAIAGNPIAEMRHMPVLGNRNAPIYAQTEESADFPSGEDELFDSGEHKSIKTSFLLSLALPGAGEFYAGNKIKAGAFLAAEIALWTGVIVYNNKGNDGEEAYRVFADAHWEFEYYHEWFRGFGNDSIYTEQLPVHEHIEIVGDDTIYTYTPNKTHDYYEMIGKYDWFLLGWEDLPNRDAIRDSSAMFSDHSNILEVLKRHRDNSQLRLDYMNLRKETNDYFTYSKYFIGAAIFNHLLSAFDAAWTAKRANDRMYEGFTFAPKMEAHIVFSPQGELEPRIVVNLAKF
ncbi:MAG TPA: hypothetical protein ENN07_08555 [candidate division Zixibacteria bacterium]|nr:hypothetical protein [candidate division Zixibacteria bacterium]